MRSDRLLAVGDDRFRDRDAQREDPFRAHEARVDVAHRLEGADHQPRRDEQDDGERDLGDDQTVARAVTLASGARETPTFLERRREVRRHEFHDRQQAEEEPRQQRNGEREQQDEWIDPDLAGAGQAVRRVGDERPDAGICQAEADDPAREGKGEAFRQQLPGDPARARAERGVDRQFLLPRLGAHQEQIRDVGAGDQQDQADRAEEHPEHASNVADHVGSERPDVGADLDVVEHLAREAGRHAGTDPG